MTTTTISKGRVSAEIDSMGAELTSFKLDGNEYLWQADPEVWSRHAPVLFPIVGCLRDGVAQSAEGTCSMGRHGVARNFEHSVAHVSEDGAIATFELSENEETLAQFPYKFTLNMTYAITGSATLSQTFKVTNTGKVNLPFSVGGHPAFNVPCPGSDGEAFEDYVIKFTKPWSCSVPLMAEGGLIDMETPNITLEKADTLALTHELFAKDSLMFTDVPDRTLTLLGTKSGHGVKVDFDRFRYIGVWSALGEAPFVALEPWTGYTTAIQEDDVFEHKADITVLAPGNTFVRTFSMTLF